MELSFDSVQEVQDQEVWASHQLAWGQGRGERHCNLKLENYNLNQVKARMYDFKLIYSDDPTHCQEMKWCTAELMSKDQHMVDKYCVNLYWSWLIFIWHIDVGICMISRRYKDIWICWEAVLSCVLNISLYLTCAPFRIPDLSPFPYIGPESLSLHWTWVSFQTYQLLWCLLLDIFWHCSTWNSWLKSQ